MDGTNGSNFSDFITRERERLNGEREQIFNQQRELEGKLGEVDREISAIEAYESAKTGKSVAVSSGRRGRGGTGRVRGRKGSKREALLNMIKSNPAGLRRGEIIDKMGLKGDKSGEMSVSNALTALVKSQQIERREGKYVTLAAA